MNATGVFADTVRRLDNPEAGPSVSPSQGVHLVLPQAFLPGTHALVVPKTDDGRVLFIIPWHGRTVVGTTDTPVAVPVEEPKPLAEEVGFLLEHAGRYLVKDPTRRDVLSVFAGLRPLVRPPAEEGAGTASLSRDHHVFTSPSGLVTIVGGKWTTYRKMAEDVVTLAAEVARLPAVPCRTGGLRLHGAPEDGETSDVGVPTGPLASYGTEAPDLLALARREPELNGPLHPRLPYLEAEVVWAVRHEMARTVEDVLARRTRALLLDARASAECAPRVARLLARELGRDAAWERRQVDAYRALAEAALL